MHSARAIQRAERPGAEILRMSFRQVRAKHGIHVLLKAAAAFTGSPSLPAARARISWLLIVPGPASHTAANRRSVKLSALAYPADASGPRTSLTMPYHNASANDTFCSFITLLT